MSAVIVVPPEVAFALLMLSLFFVFVLWHVGKVIMEGRQYNESCRRVRELVYKWVLKEEIANQLPGIVELVKRPGEVHAFAVSTGKSSFVVSVLADDTVSVTGDDVHYYHCKIAILEKLLNDINSGKQLNYKHGDGIFCEIHTK